jgi:hypothetical protein
LASTEIDAFGADVGVIAYGCWFVWLFGAFAGGWGWSFTLWQRYDEIVNLGVLAGLVQVFICDGALVDGKQDVFPDGA